MDKKNLFFKIKVEEITIFMSHTHKYMQANQHLFNRKVTEMYLHLVCLITMMDDHLS
jgi:hypothetical protein